MSTSAPLSSILSEKFAPKNAISRAEFREFFGISVSTDFRAFKSGKYPRVIRIGNHDRILLADIVAFLDQTQETTEKKIEKRGRPRRSANPAELLATLRR